MKNGSPASREKGFRLIDAPAIGWRYWVVLCCASVLGADLGDLLSRELGLGYWRGLPVLIAAFCFLLFASRRAPRSTVWYWLSIVIVRAAATNLADWQALNEGQPPSLRFDAAFPVVIGTWSVLLVLLALRDRRETQGQVRTNTDLWFWGTMLAAGTLGTAVGDWLAFLSGLGLQGATALTTVALAVALVTLVEKARSQIFPFWILVSIIRTWGTNVGDLSADATGGWLTFGVAAVSTLIAFVLLYESKMFADNEPSNGH